METPRPRELPIIGGNLALDYANTVDDPLGPARHDHVSNYEDLLRWSLRVGTLTEPRVAALRREAERHPRRARAALGKAHELRDGLNEVFGGVATGEGDLSTSWETTLRGFATAALAAAELHPVEEGRQAWTWPDDGDLVAPLHPVAWAAADLVVSPDLRRVKRCARCPWLFLDQSKNRSRRWCDMDDCGRAQKIERYVARRAAARKR